MSGKVLWIVYRSLAAGEPQPVTEFRSVNAHPGRGDGVNRRNVEVDDLARVNKRLAERSLNAEISRKSWIDRVSKSRCQGERSAK